MDLAFEIVGWALLVGGGLFSLIGGIGLMRLPDMFTRMHASGITDTLGATLVLLGLIVHSASEFDWPALAGSSAHETPLDWGPLLIGFKLISILVFLLISSPTATHALARAALGHGLEPQGLTEEDPPSNT